MERKFEETKKKYRAALDKITSSKRKIIRLEELPEGRSNNPRILRASFTTAPRPAQQQRAKPKAGRNKQQQQQQQQLQLQVQQQLLQLHLQQTQQPLQQQQPKQQLKIAQQILQLQETQQQKPPQQQQIQQQLLQLHIQETKQQPQPLQQQQPKQQLKIAQQILQLQDTQQQQQQPQQPQQQPETDILASYPPGGRGQTIYTMDLRSTDDRGYLTDVVVNTTLTWVHREVLTSRMAEQVRVCESHWFDQVAKDGEVRKNMERMKRWFSGVGHPFNRRVVVVPVCYRSHWVVAICWVEDNAIEIWGMDSLHSQVLGHVQQILEASLKVCQPDKIIRWRTINVPRQKNGHDCGIHAIWYATRTLQLARTAQGSTVEAIGEQLAADPHPIERKDVREALRGIISGRVGPHPTFILNATVELMAELDLSLTDTEEPNNFAITPGTERLVCPGVAVRNATNELVLMDKAFEDWLVELAREIREEILAKCARRMRLRKTGHGRQILVRAKASGEVRFVVQ